MTFLDNKFLQSITAFLVSFSATLVDVGEMAVQNYSHWLELGQLITIYGGILIGLIRFVYWWKDRKSALKKTAITKKGA
jgi:hypothetical protein